MNIVLRSERILDGGNIGKFDRDYVKVLFKDKNKNFGECENRVNTPLRAGRRRSFGFGGGIVVLGKKQKFRFWKGRGDFVAWRKGIEGGEGLVLVGWRRGAVVGF